MERVWRRVRRGAAPKSSAAGEAEAPPKRGRGQPQTIVCGCQVQPCPVHPVLIRVRRSQRPPPPDCDCPPASQPCAHAPRPAAPRRARRCDCAERACRHVATSTRRRPQGLSSLFAGNSAAVATALSAGTGSAPHCPHGDGEVCDCRADARPCSHPVRRRRSGACCDCPAQPCPSHEGRIRRVKWRVRRAARCTAELAMLHLHWQLGPECRPRALTRRLCRRQHSDNELYRSNSFKFERFERAPDDAAAPSHNQVSLCDEYSLPVDFVNKKRPVSVAVAPTTTIQWTIPSPTVETKEIEVVEQYSDPKDIRNRIDVQQSVDSSQPAFYTKANLSYCRPSTDPSASGSSCEDDEITGRLSNARKRKNPVYATSSANRNSSLQAAAAAAAAAAPEQQQQRRAPVDCVAVVHEEEELSLEEARHRSPYYYGDLFKPAQPPSSLRQPSKYRKSASLEAPAERSRSLGLIPKQASLTEGGDAAAGGQACPGSPQPGPVLARCLLTHWDYSLVPSHHLPASVCTCLASAEEDELDSPPAPAPDQPPPRLPPQAHPRHKVRKLRRSRKVEPHPIVLEDRADEAELEDEGDEEYEDDEEEDEEMARQRQIYETAFDCKISRSDDDLDDLDRMTNHPVLLSQMRNSSATAGLSRASSSTESSKQSQQNLGGRSHASKENRRSKLLLLRPRAPAPPLHSDNTSSLSQEIESLQIGSNDERSGYSASPPSSGPPKLALQREPGPAAASPKCRPRSLAAHEPGELFLEIKGRPAGQESQGPALQRPRPRSLHRDSRPIMEFKGRPHEAEAAGPEAAARARREQQASLLEMKLRGHRRRPGYSSTESMATSSSGGSMESLRSSTSEGNRSTSSSESRRSTSLSSHSSDSGGGCPANCFARHPPHGQRRQHRPHNGAQQPHQQPHQQPQQQPQSLSNLLAHHATKLHILSPISDKSSQEPASETSDNNRNNNSQKASPEEPAKPGVEQGPAHTPTDTGSSSSFKKRRAPQNKNLINLALQSSSSADAEIHGSDSGISIESRAGVRCNAKPFGLQPGPLLPPGGDAPLNINQLLDAEHDLQDLPFDMPKLRRRRLLMQQDATTSGSATSVDLKDLPFDMPKLRRRLRCTQSTESTGSHASSSQSIRDLADPPPLLFGGGLARPKMTLNLDGANNGVVGDGQQQQQQQQQLAPKKPGSLGLGLGLSLELNASRGGNADLVDVQLPLERQGWYHGSITRIEAEAVLRLLREGSYLVRNSESTKQDYSLSLKSARGFMHMRIQKNEELNAYILGQFSKPFDSIPEMVQHFSINRLPIRGAEHMCLLHPVIAQLL